MSFNAQTVHSDRSRRTVSGRKQRPAPSSDGKRHPKPPRTDHPNPGAPRGEWGGGGGGAAGAKTGESKGVYLHSCRQDAATPSCVDPLRAAWAGRLLDVGILLAWSRLTPLIGGAARCSHLYGEGVGWWGEPGLE